MPPELTQRKRTVIADLKKNMLTSKETDHGYAYEFEGTDLMIDQIAEFIKTERECCNFFTFTLSVGKETESVWLELSGPRGSKEFIKNELEL